MVKDFTVSGGDMPQTPIHERKQLHYVRVDE